MVTLDCTGDEKGKGKGKGEWKLSFEKDGQHIGDIMLPPNQKYYPVLSFYCPNPIDYKLTTFW